MASVADFFDDQTDGSRSIVFKRVIKAVASFRAGDKSRNSPFRALLIDDDPISVKLIEFCLKRAGCETQIVTSAAEAAHLYSSQTYDLVILDWEMPDLNGAETLELLQKIVSTSPRERESTILTPVLTYSTLNIDSSNFKSPTNDFALVGHMPKATTYQDLRDRLVELVKLLRYEE